MPQPDGLKMVEMLFRGPGGRDEMLWVEPLDSVSYRVISVPVWQYGVSRGTVVASLSEAQELEADGIIAPSPGATVRFSVTEGMVASDVYRSQVQPMAKRRSIRIGPATFFDPSICAVHIDERAEWWPAFGSILEDLRSRAILSEWECGDPDQGDSPTEDLDGIVPTLLRHPLPDPTDAT